MIDEEFLLTLIKGQDELIDEMAQHAEYIKQLCAYVKKQDAYIALVQESLLFYGDRETYDHAIEVDDFGERARNLLTCLPS